ncbi:MAG: hypothetical protein DRP46_07365 [Candidatus Zixiibacteriota bacterium]|nr:MAG: hypothetical protein DRP46_07365 [candidate division Zixibacteria bacterium]
MIWRILVVAVLIVAAGFGYVFIKDKIEADKRAEYTRFAGAVAETSIAAELYRNNSDSFFIVRDSILNKYAMTIRDIELFREKLKEKQIEWTEVWLKIDSITDSLVKLQYDRLAREKDTTADTLLK